MMNFFSQTLFNNINIKVEFKHWVDTDIVNFVSNTGWWFYIYA